MKCDRSFFSDFSSFIKISEAKSSPLLISLQDTTPNHAYNIYQLSSINLTNGTGVRANTRFM